MKRAYQDHSNCTPQPTRKPEIRTYLYYVPCHVKVTKKLRIRRSTSELGSGKVIRSCRGSYDESAVRRKPRDSYTSLAWLPLTCVQLYFLPEMYHITIHHLKFCPLRTFHCYAGRRPLPWLACKVARAAEKVCFATHQLFLPKPFQ